VAIAVFARLEWRWLVLGWIGLVPWLAALDRARSVRGALAAGLVLSAVFTVAVFGWFAGAIQTYTGLSFAAALPLLALFGPLLQPQFPVFAVARHVARRRGHHAFWLTALMGALVYVGTEWAWPKLFGDTLGHGLYASLWMRQAADVAGAPGLTVVLLIANACVLEGVRVMMSATAGGGAAAMPRRLRSALAPVACIVVLAVALLAYGAVRVRQIAASVRGDAPVTAAVVQANLSHYDELRAEHGTYETVRMILDTYFALSTEALARGGVDLLVWPETVYPTTFGVPKSADGAAFDDEIATFVTRTGVPLVFGSYDAENGREFNAAFFLEPAHPREYTTYRKAWPFPLTEHVPAWLDSPALRARLPWLGTWYPGNGAKVVALTLADGRVLRIAPLICYDVLDPGLVLAAVREGADLIVTLSNDSWFEAGAGPRQHLLGAAFRSIETRRPQLRATNTGISAIITPTGEIVASAGTDERAILTASLVPERAATTLAVAWGDWLGPVALSLGLALLLALAARRDQRRSSMGARQASTTTISST
jgi:apolipoprotein N-acyltransferase